MEVKRQLFHLVFGLILVVLLYYNVLDISKLFLLLIFGLILSLVSLKFRVGIASWFLDKFDRKDNNVIGQGCLSFVAGSLIVLVLFEKEIALAGIMVLTLGDSFSHLGNVSKKIRHPFNNVKFIEGVLIGIVVAAIGASFFVSWIEAFLGASVAMIFESFDFRVLGNKIDDNFLIPLISCFIIWVV